MLLVDEFAKNLREGRVELPLNDRSRELMREVEKLKAQLSLLENRAFGGGMDMSKLNPSVLSE
jgi:hypothetical protein